MGQPLRPGSQMGDPGFLDYLKRKAMAGMALATNVFTGGVSGAVAGSVAAATRPRPSMVRPPMSTVVGPGQGQYPIGVPKPGILAATQQFVPGGETGLGQGCAKGYRPNKTSYWLKNGTHVPAGSKCVKYRRRYNPANAKATSRSIGRLNSAKRMQGALSEISTGKYTASGKRKAHTH